MVDEILGILILLTYLVLPYLAIRVGRKKEGIHRLDFLGRIVFLVVAAVGIALLWLSFSFFSRGQEWVSSIVFFTGIFAFIYIRLSITVLRLNDVRWSPWWVYVSLIPTVGGLLFLTLLFFPPREGKIVELEAG